MATNRKTREMRGQPDVIMEMLLALMEEFAAAGRTEEAGPLIHQLMGIAYRGAGRGTRLSPPPTPAPRSASRRASASSRP